MKQLKRILCMLLSLTLVVGMLPLSAIAEEWAGNDPIGAADIVRETPEEESILLELSSEGDEESDTPDVESVLLELSLEDDDRPAPKEGDGDALPTPEGEPIEQGAPIVTEKANAPDADDDKPAPEEGDGDALPTPEGEPNEQGAPIVTEKANAPDADDDRPAPKGEPIEQGDPTEEAKDGDPALPKENLEEEKLLPASIEAEADAFVMPNAQGKEADTPNAAGDKLFYDANAGTDPVGNMPSTQTADAANEVYVSADRPTRDNYLFLGWSSSASGSVEYHGGEKINLDGDMTLYAIWQGTVVLRYDGNGAESGVPASESAAVGSTLTAAAAPVRAKYRFTGWLGSDGNTYQPGDSITMDADITLTAQWVEQVTIHFDLNGGDSFSTAFSQDITIDKGTKRTISVGTNGATRSNYQFLGFDTNPNAADPTYYIYYAGLVTARARSYPLTPGEDVTLYAIWGVNYHLSYNPNTDDPSVDGMPLSDNAKQFGTWVHHSAYEPTRDGYDFAGWTYDAEGTQDAMATFSKTGFYKIDHDTVLYAQWEEESVTLTFDINGGTGTAPAPIKYVFGKTTDATIPDDTGFEKEHYNFKGWGTTKTTKTIEYSAGEVLTDATAPTWDSTYYAVWEAKKYRASFDLDGGTSSVGTYNAGYEEQTYSTSRRFTLWYFKTAERMQIAGTDAVPIGLTDTDTGDFYDVSTTTKYVPANRDYNFKVVWQVNAVYDGNGATEGVPAGGPVNKGTEITLPAIEREGFRFDGWLVTDTNDPTGVKKAAGETVTVGNYNITLTAQWIDQVTIHFDGNGGTKKEHIDDVTLDKGAIYTLNVSSLNAERDGFQFLGWDKNAGAAEPAYYIYYPGITTSTNRYYDITADDNITLYAIWGTNYHLAYDGNAGGDEVRNLPRSDNKNNYGTWVYHSAYTPSRTGYTFKGFTFDAEGTQDASATFTKSGWYKIDKDTTLYAQWEPINYTYKFDLNGGTGTKPADITFNADEIKAGRTIAMPEQGDIAYTGKVFIGWSTTKQAVTGTTVKATYAPGEVLTEETVRYSNQTLYAVWHVVQFTIRFELNGGKGSFADKQVNYGATYTLPASVPTKDGYTFKGWLAEDGVTVYQKSEKIANVLSDMTLTAQWEETEITIKFNKAGRNLESGTKNIVPADAVMPDPITGLKQGDTVDLPVGTAISEEYTVVGWAASLADAGKEKTVANPYTIKVMGAVATITMYPIWKQFTATFTGEDGSTLSTEVGGIVTVPAGPAVAGKRFLGWKNGDTFYQEGDKTVLTEDMTFTATYIEQVTLHFDANGGTTTRTDVTLDIGTEYTFKYWADDAQKADHQFLGWDIKPNATEPEYGIYRVGLTTLVTPIQKKIVMDADLTLYAVYGKNYVLTFDANAEDPLSGWPKTATGTYVRGITTKPSRTGFTFLGWSYEKDGGTLTTDFTKSQYYKLEGDTTLYAQWKELVYTIKFDLNGGAGTVPENITYTAKTKDSTSIVLPAADGFTKEGRVLVGWSYNTKRTDLSISAKLSTSDYAPGATIPSSKLQTPTKDTTYTVYAVWQKTPVTVTMDLNGGTKGPSGYPKTLGYGDDLSLPLQGASYPKQITLPDGTTDKLFAQGYYCPETKTFYKIGNQAAGDAGKMKNITEDRTLIWVWPYAVVTFMDDSTLLGFEKVEFEYGTGPKAPVQMLDAPEKDGYVFKGWSTAPGGAVEYAPNASYDGVRDITLYAVYVKTFVVTYDGNGADSAVPAPETVETGTTVTAADAPTRDGFRFTGWLGSDGKTYQPGDTITVDADITLTAQWIEQVTVMFDLNGGTPDSAFDAKTLDVGTTFAIPTTVPTREKHRFTGWQIVDDTNLYQPGDTITADADTTLTAQWIEQVTVTFDLNGGTPDSAFDAKTLDAGTAFAIPTTVPTQEEHRFTGWLGSDGKTYQPGDTITVDADITLTAQWMQFTATFLDEDGSTIAVEKGIVIQMPTVEKKPLRIFLGWMSGDKLYETDTVTLTEDMTFVATYLKLERVENVEPTCETDGNIEYYYAEETDEYFLDAYGDKKIAKADTVLPAHGHDWESSVTTQPTVDREGVRTYVCKHDPTHTYTEPIPRLKPGQENSGISFQLGSFGPKFKDINETLTKEDFAFTVVDLSENGEYTFAVVGNDRYEVGAVIVTVKDGTVKVELKLEPGFVLTKDSFFTLFADIDSVKSLEAADLKNFAFGEEYSIANDLGGDTDVLLFLVARATYTGDIGALKPFDASSAENVKLIEEMMAHIGK